MSRKQRLIDSMEAVNRRHDGAFVRLAGKKGSFTMRTKKQIVKALTQTQYFAFDHPLVTTMILTAFFMTMCLIIALRKF